VVPEGLEGPKTEVHLSVSSRVDLVSGLCAGFNALVLNL
jgi:hypothetical protein